MGDGALTKEKLDEMMVEWRAWREEIGAPVAAPVTKSASAPAVKDAGLIKSIMTAVAPVIHELEQKVTALSSRVAELERGQKTYLGVWKEGREYSPHSEVTHDGGRWFCHKRTSDKPGTSCDWMLMEKTAPTATPRSETATAHSRVNGHHANPRRP